MNNKGHSQSQTLLRRITAGVAVLLLVLTLLLAVKARTKTSTGFTAYIASQNTIVYLRSQPLESSQTIGILNHGAEVFVDYSTTRNGTTWYYVKTENNTGWIPETSLSLTQP